ncbi:hypothetical protein ABPG72_013679 [Tetrahymena utriculariae]
MNHGDIQNLLRNYQLQQLEIIQEDLEEQLLGTRAINVLFQSVEDKNQPNLDQDEQIFQNKIQEELNIVDNYFQQDNSYYDDDNTFEYQNSMLYQQNDNGQHQILGLVHETNIIEEDECGNEQDIQNENISKQTIYEKSYGLQLSPDEIKTNERQFYIHHKLINQSNNYQKNNDQGNLQLQNNIIANTDQFKIQIFDLYFQNQMIQEEKIKYGRILSQPANDCCDDIIIGRGLAKNSINLNKDSQVSQQHCKLITQYYYQQDNTQLDSLNLVIKFFEQKYKQITNSRDILTKVFTLIQVQDTLKKFLYQKPCLYFVDLSSKNGSQVLIDYQKCTKLCYDQQLQCGSINLHVKEINDLQYYDNFLTLISDYLFEELLREQNNEQQTLNKCGLPKTYLDFAIESFKQISVLLQKKDFYSTIKKQGLSEIYKIWILKFLQAKLKKSNRMEVKMIPYIKLKVQHYLQKDRSKYFFLFHDKKNPKIFKVGKSRECDVQIDSSQVSRNHCEINYDPQTCQWLIRDGFLQNKERKPSKNKTWINLYNNQQNDYLETIPYRLDSDQETVIMLGKTILKIQKEEDQQQIY